jgi:hypothetical protein
LKSGLDAQAPPPVSGQRHGSTIGTHPITKATRWRKS